MPGKKPSAAVRAFQHWLQQAVSCVTEEQVALSAGGLEPSTPQTPPHTVSFRNDPILLRTDGPDGGLFLTMAHHYRVIRPEGTRRWKVRTAAYYYGVDDEDGREILAYHWHPDAVPAVPFPHLHLSAGVVSRAALARGNLAPAHNALRADLIDAHVPTGRIALEQMLAFAIRHLNVRPRRTDWEAAFRSTLGNFTRDRSWSAWDHV